MSVRVVARIRPLLRAEIEKDVIVEAAGSAAGKTIVKIPNPKCQSETYSFQFNSVYDSDTNQALLYDNEVAPSVKQLFKGYDVTLFAYGVTGTGKTHTMRGGKSLQDRGVIPRLLSSIYRRARKIEKDSEGRTEVEILMSYYEIYNDKVFDLFEPPEKRTPAGLPIRDNNGKTVVVGLTERPCTTLKEFERLYDEANVNRSTSATKLNAHSSRSHAILCVKIVQTSGNESRISTASAIDLAGSEDNRRTDNNKDRLVESANINKSLFVLAQCVEAISKKQVRIPYRESKMTRILSLGQNDGITVMILNLAPVRSYHLDTLSSLNFANRTKKIEVNEIENLPFFRDPQIKGKADGQSTIPSETSGMLRQPLRPKIPSQNVHLKDVAVSGAKPARQFSVYSDDCRLSTNLSNLVNTNQARLPGNNCKPSKRTSSDTLSNIRRPSKTARLDEPARLTRAPTSGLSKDAIEALIDRKVSEALAERVDSTTVSQPEPISDEMQRRLEALEKRVEGQESERAEGLQYLLMAKQHQVRGEDASALRMYQLALPHFPGNEKLGRKVARLQDKIAAKTIEQRSRASETTSTEVRSTRPGIQPLGKRKRLDEDDESYHEAQDDMHSNGEDDDFMSRPRTKIRRPQKTTANRVVHVPSLPYDTMQTANNDSSEDELASALTCQTPRTKLLLHIVNSKDVGQIKLLKGVGARKAVAIVNCLCDAEHDAGVTSLDQLGRMRGVGVKTVLSMRSGLVV